MDCHCSLKLALTLSTLVRHQCDDCTTCPTPLTANLEANIEANLETNVSTIPERTPSMLNAAQWPLVKQFIAGLTISQSTVSAGHLQFGSWVLLPRQTPPVVLTLGLQLDITVRPQNAWSSTADHTRHSVISSLCTV